MSECKPCGSGSPLSPRAQMFSAMVHETDSQSTMRYSEGDANWGAPLAEEKVADSESDGGAVDETGGLLNLPDGYVPV